MLLEILTAITAFLYVARARIRSRGGRKCQGTQTTPPGISVSTQTERRYDRTRRGSVSDMEIIDDFYHSGDSDFEIWTV